MPILSSLVLIQSMLLSLFGAVMMYSDWCASSSWLASTQVDGGAKLREKVMRIYCNGLCDSVVVLGLRNLVRDGPRPTTWYRLGVPVERQNIVLAVNLALGW
ncbi:hypothetical protein KC338_g171 [Hortaea werneckii]|nr:hypothetical protein KC338_g171 [Hortaea werneckii]